LTLFAVWFEAGTEQLYLHVRKDGGEMNLTINTAFCDDIFWALTATTRI